MFRVFFSAALMVAVLPVSPLSAGFITYTDRASFQTALGSFTTDSMNYSAGEQTCGSGAIGGGNAAYFTINTVPNALKFLGSPCPGGFDTTGDVSARYLYLDTDIAWRGSSTTFTMHNPTFGFGFDYMGINEPDTLWQVSVLGVFFNPAPNDGSLDAKFWGIISTAAFTTIVLTTDIDSGYGIDEVTFGGSGMIIPEPAPLILVGLGLLVFGLRHHQPHQ
jgi:hypothetical protein